MVNGEKYSLLSDLENEKNDSKPFETEDDENEDAKFWNFDNSHSSISLAFTSAESPLIPCFSSNKIVFDFQNKVYSPPENR
jgi:hypothetical protein